MLVDEAVFHRARKLDPHAIEALLISTYPAIHRIAHALTGRGDVGDGVVRFVVRQSIQQLPRLRDAEAARRWFYHHTVLTTRRAQRHQPSPRDEVLLPRGPVDAAYAAFIRALRALPPQPREAFILHYAEGLDARTLGIAMDCSTQAARMHLSSAESSLGQLAGDTLPALRERMVQAYARLAPAEELFRPALRRQVARALLPKRIGRLLWLLLVIVLLLGALVAAHYLGWIHLPPAPR